MKKLIYPLLLLLLLVVAVEGTEFNYYFNHSELPFTHVESMMLAGYNNLSVNISYGQFTSGLDYFVFSTGIQQLDIDINVTDNISSGNYTDVVTIFNNIQNFSVSINFNFYVINDTPVPDVDYMQIDIDEYSYDLCDYQLPWNTTKEVTINAQHGQTIYTDFDEDFFDMPDSFEMPPENYTILVVGIHLANLTPKTYNKAVRFSVVSEYNNITFHFNIRDCVEPMTRCNNIFRELRTCELIENKTIDDILECADLQVKYDNCLLEVLTDAAATKIVHNETIIYVNDTEYIPVLPLDDPEVVETLKDIVVVWKQVRSELRAGIKDRDDAYEARDQALDEKNEMMERIPKEVQKALSDLIQKYSIQENTIDDYEERYIEKSTVITWVIVILIIIGLIFGYFYYHNNMFW